MVLVGCVYCGSGRVCTVVLVGCVYCGSGRVCVLWFCRGCTVVL